MSPRTSIVLPSRCADREDVRQGALSMSEVSADILGWDYGRYSLCSPLSNLLISHAKRPLLGFLDDLIHTSNFRIAGTTPPPFLPCPSTVM